MEPAEFTHHCVCLDIETGPRGEVIGLGAKTSLRPTFTPLNRSVLSERKAMEVYQPHPAGKIMSRGTHGECNGTRERHTEIDEVIQALEQGGGIREKVHFIQEECPEAVVPVQSQDKVPCIVIPFQCIRGQVKGIIMLECVLAEQYGLSGPSGPDYPDETIIQNVRQFRAYRIPILYTTKGGLPAGNLEYNTEHYLAMFPCNAQQISASCTLFQEGPMQASPSNDLEKARSMLFGLAAGEPWVGPPNSCPWTGSRTDTAPRAFRTFPTRPSSRTTPRWPWPFTAFSGLRTITPEPSFGEPTRAGTRAPLSVLRGP